MEKTIMQVQAKTVVALVCGIAAAFLIATAFTVIGSQPAKAMPAYAQQTGKACGFCHKAAGGGGPLTAAGEKFKANGHKL
jgi:mono/diheme cytochrome c family protein